MQMMQLNDLQQQLCQ